MLEAHPGFGLSDLLSFVPENYNSKQWTMLWTMS